MIIHPIVPAVALLIVTLQSLTVPQQLVGQIVAAVQQPSPRLGLLVACRVSVPDVYHPSKQSRMISASYLSSPRFLVGK